MLLHKIDSSPFESTALNRCIAKCGADDAILLTQDGVYAMVHAPSKAQLADHRTFVLKADLLARSISADAIDAVETIDDQRMVALCLEYNNVLSW